MSVKIDSGPFEPHKWPTREEWARQRRNAYWDSENPHPYQASRRLSDYASPDEIAAAVASLQEVYRDYGRRMKEAKKAAGALAQQPAESYGDWCSRWRTMTEAEREIAHEPECIRSYRREINAVLKQMREEDLVPWRWMGAGLETPPQPLNTIMARYEAAVQAGNEKWITEVKARPIDDDAWAEEIERRRDIERRYPHWFTQAPVHNPAA